jgi:hypothetical protein
LSRTEGINYTKCGLLPKRCTVRNLYYMRLHVHVTSTLFPQTEAKPLNFEDQRIG